MNHKALFFLLTLTLALALTGCSPAATSTTDPTRPVLADLNRDLLSSYSATYDIHFIATGGNGWNYQLKTRKSPSLREETLHIEGIDKTRNPGDIRLLTDGTTSWMIGAGTDDECVQFPNHAGMDPTFLYPDSLLSLPDLNSILQHTTEETTAGKASLHYSGAALTLGQWKDVRVDVWQEKTSGALLRFSLQAQVDDPFFGAGQGNLQASYTVDALEAGTIAAVEGCELSIPLPEVADKFVRLPGLASFETPASVDQMMTFYQQILAQEDWVQNEAPAQSGQYTVLSFSRGAERVEIQLEATASGGSKVKMVFLKNE